MELLSLLTFSLTQVAELTSVSPLSTKGLAMVDSHFVRNVMLSSVQNIKNSADPIRSQEDDPAIFLFVNSFSVLTHLEQSGAVDPDWVRAYWQEAFVVVGDCFTFENVDITTYVKNPLLSLIFCRSGLVACEIVDSVFFSFDAAHLNFKLQ